VKQALRADHRLSVGKYGYDRVGRELARLRCERLQAAKRWKAKRDYLRRLLGLGATIEKGIHTVALERRQRIGLITPTEYQQLRVS
jgi:hypothetical protein